ncbi:MAG: hypothetical protein DCF27_13955 [Lysobacteraceae bacterium]|nr:MAG: hypothetical protein DCF27_13955 [Xanthomonadaceae bacterium]
MNHDEGNSPDDAHTLPKRTTPTWDMELLLSGATVFALFQGAQAMMAGGAYLLPRLQGDLLVLAEMLFTYGYGGLILLALTFALHLVIRAYWVAMIGMNSVYPNGIKLDALNAGPLAKSLLTRRGRSMEDRIERADNGATIVFGIGVSIVLVLVPVALVVTVMLGFLTLVGWLTGQQEKMTWLIVALMAAVFVPYMVLTTVDKRRGDRLAPGSLGYRLTLAGLEFYSRIGLSRASNTLVTVFSSNIGERRGQAIIFTVILVAMLSSTAGLFLSQKDLGMGSFGAFPDPRRGMPSSVDGRAYASSHEPDWSPTSPYLSDPVVSGSYLRLVVPYVPSLHGHLMEKCASAPEARLSAEEGPRREALRSCFTRQLQVQLDGEKVTLVPEWYTEPVRDLRGLLYMVPVRDLAKGRHEVSVFALPSKELKADEDPPQREVIPFWR